MFSERDDLVLAALTELSEALLEKRREVYVLQQQVDDLRRFRATASEAHRLIRQTRSILASITWSEDLEEARDLAGRALRSDFDHGGPPPDLSV